MQCIEFQESIADWMDEQLESATRGDMQRHMATCEGCHLAWTQHQRYRAAMGSMALAAPPEDLAFRIRQQTAVAGIVSTVTCEEVQPHLPAFVEGVLEHTIFDKVVVHTALCDACYSNLNQLQLQTELLLALPPVPVPAGLKEQILSAVHAPKQAWSWRGLASARLLPRWAFGIAAAAACVALLALSSRDRSSNIVPVLTGPEVEVAQNLPTGNAARTLPSLAAEHVNESSAQPWEAQRPNDHTDTAVASEPRQPRSGEARRPVTTRNDKATADIKSGAARVDSLRPAREEVPIAAKVESRAPKVEKTVITRADIAPSYDIPEDNDWDRSEFDARDTWIPNTPMDIPKPSTTIYSTTTATKVAPEMKTTQRMIVLDISAPSTDRRPLDDLRRGLVDKQRRKGYPITEDAKIPSKMLSVNVFRLKFD